jgi:Tol biopolymer transport system component
MERWFLLLSRTPTITCSGWTRRVNLSAPSVNPAGTPVSVSLPIKAGWRSNGTVHHDLWLYDLRRNELRGEDLLPTQFTSGVTAGLPVWSNDGTKIAFAAENAGTFEIHLKSTFGTMAEEALVTTRNSLPLDWAPDGSALLYSTDQSSLQDATLWAMPLHGAHTPLLLLKAPSYPSDAVFSPNMRGPASGITAASDLLR